MPTLTINGRDVPSARGDTLIDAGLGGRIVIPHDCSSGQCGTCRVRVLAGDVDDAGTRQGVTVLACRAKVRGDAAIAFDPVPDVHTVAGEINEIAELSPTIWQVRVVTRRRFVWLSGQYAKVTFKGYPSRDLSPTFPLDLEIAENELVFHITRNPAGAVSSHIGGAIGLGHQVSIRGPFGSAFLRHEEGPLVLASTGTGFAPVWAIAVSARLGQTWRPLTLVAGSRLAEDLYMRPAAEVLEARGGRMILTASDGDGTIVARARPQNLLPAFGSDAVVYAAGAPKMVEAVGLAAAAVQATFHADSFTPAEPAPPTFAGRLRSMLRRS